MRSGVGISGGSGGAGSAGANGGRGGDAVLRDAVSGVSDGRTLEFHQRAFGGDGGSVNGGGAGGQGGDAASTLDVIHPGTAGLEVVLDATGGDGGNSDGAKGRGGNARVGGTATNTGDVTLRVTARGGKGGSNVAAISAHPASAAGGTVTIDPLHATSTTGGRVTVKAIAVEGSAGSGPTGLDGADLMMVNRVSGTTTGLLVLFQQATAGAGGDALTSGSGGSGGNASSSLDHAGSHQTLDVEARATGGRGGRGGASGGDGGSAAVFARGFNDAGTGSARGFAAGGAGASASGGGSLGGRGGDADLQLVAETSGAGNAVFIGSGSNSTGGWASMGGRGGDAMASARAEAFGNSRVSASIGAGGGGGGNTFLSTPGGRGGDAHTDVFGRNAGNDDVFVSGGSGGGRGGSGAGGLAAGQGGDATVRAAAHSTGGGDLEIRLRATGGEGGGNRTGDGARGGDAILQNPLDFSTAGDVTISLTSNGGQGGTGSAPNRHGAGGDATASADVSHLGGGNLTLNLWARGGTAGPFSPAGPGPGGSAFVSGDAVGMAGVTVDARVLSTPGGSATLGPVSGHSLGGGSVSVTAHKGDAAGEDVTLTDVVSGDTAGQLFLEQNAWAEQGGNATSQLTAVGQSGSVGATADARGGRALATTNVTNAAGNAGAVSSATAGASESAAARSMARSHGDGHGANARSFATGGFLLSQNQPGGDSIAVADGVAADDGVVDVLSVSTGGSTPNQFTVGTGGNAQASARGSNHGASQVNVKASAFGGRSRDRIGGAAGATADGSSLTGDVSVSASQQPGFVDGSALAATNTMIDAVAGSTAGTLTLHQTALGGGSRTVGGSSSSSLRATNAGGGALGATSEAVGGLGTIQGGDATASLFADENTSADLLLTAIAKGGEGGDGGTATLGPVYGRSQGGGSVRVLGTGVGGQASSSGASGAVHLVDSVDGDTTGLLMLEQRAFGGSSRSRTRDGQAGAASSILRRTKSAGYLELTTLATAGLGKGDGQQADAQSDGRNLTGTAEANALARGGQSIAADDASGGTGVGGGAVAKASATSDVAAALAHADAFGGQAGVWSGNSPLPGTAGGGDATAQADANGHGPVRAEAKAIAGRGGQIAPTGQALSGGDGGDARAIARGTSTSGDDVSVNAEARGGTGGSSNVAFGVGGQAYANAYGSSAAGDAVVQASQTAGSDTDSLMVNQASGLAGGLLTLVQNSFAGARADAASMLSAENAGGGGLDLTASARGGFFDGNAHVSVVGMDRHGRDLNILAEAIGGSPSFSGAGGIASLGPVYGESTAGGNVWATGRLEHGGASFGATATDAVLVNAVDGRTSGALTIEQIVSIGYAEGDNSNVRSESTLSKTVENESLRLVADANQGAARANTSARNRGGDAHAVARAHSGFGADAFANARAVSQKDGAVVTVGVDSLPLFFNRNGARAGNGNLVNAPGSATSNSEGVHRGDGRVDVRDFAYGGNGGQSGFGSPVDGGAARSTAIARGAGVSLVEARAMATGGGTRDTARAGHSSALAVAEGLGAVGAHATIQGNGGGLIGGSGLIGQGVAQANASGASGTVSATAVGDFSIRATSTVYRQAQAEAYLTETDLFVANAVDAYSVALVNAGQVDLAPFLQGTTAAYAAVTEMDEVLGLGRLGSHHNQDGTITFSGEVHAAGAQPNPFPFPFPIPGKPGDYVLALLGLSVAEQGFEELRFQVDVDGATVIDISFSDALSATEWFDDRVFQFGIASGLLPDLDVFLDVTSSDESFGMEFEFVLGTVPEPRVLLMLLVAIAWLRARS